MRRRQEGLDPAASAQVESGTDRPAHGEIGQGGAGGRDSHHLLELPAGLDVVGVVAGQQQAAEWQQPDAAMRHSIADFDQPRPHPFLERHRFERAAGRHRVYRRADHEHADHCVERRGFPREVQEVRQVAPGPRGQLDGAERADQPFLVVSRPAEHLADARILFGAVDVEGGVAHASRF